MSKQTFLEQCESAGVMFPIQDDARAILHNGFEFPTTRDEQWKYTRVTSIISADYSKNDPKRFRPSNDQFSLSSFCTLVTVNGMFRSDLSDTLPEGLKIQTLSEAKGDVRDKILTHLGALTPLKNEAFNTLNTAYFNDGIFLEVVPNTHIEVPIRLFHYAFGEAQLTNTRNLIFVGENSSVSIMHEFEGESNAGSFTNVVTEMFADKSAKISYTLIENEGTQSSLINTVAARQKANSRFTMFTITKSGQLVRNNLRVEITETGCETNMYGIYFTSGNQHIDNHTYADHQAPNCNSNELYKGVMADKSTGVFNGKIMVHQIAQKTNAYQSNQNVLLGDKATIFSKPELEIYADDVKCSHGCTVGQLDEEALFYLRSRGLSRDAAHRLLVQAFASDIIEKIEIEEVKTSIERFIEDKFK